MIETCCIFLKPENFPVLLSHYKNVISKECLYIGTACVFAIPLYVLFCEVA